MEKYLLKKGVDWYQPNLDRLNPTVAIERNKSLLLKNLLLCGTAILFLEPEREEIPALENFWASTISITVVLPTNN